MNRKLQLALVLLLVAAFVGGTFAQAQENTVTFQSTQFNVVEESELARQILANFEGGMVEFVPSEEDRKSVV